MEENKKEDVQYDTVKLLRAVMKVSSALNDLDDLIYQGDYYKYRFKNESNKWMVLMEYHTKALMNSLVEEDHTLLQEIYNSLEESSKGINAGKKTSLILFYAKLKSCLNDLDKMDENKDSFYPRFIRIHTEKLVNIMEKQHYSIIHTIDADGKDVDYVVKFFDDFTESIMTFS
jgi:glutamate-1-semialdehyde aminotransferase